MSHPVQYYVPLYQRLARRTDLSIKVFFTWHAGDVAVRDQGFRRSIQWDIPLTSGYEFELVPNASRDPGPHHFFGLRNPSLAARVMAWRPHAVHVTGWAWHSHLQLLRTLHRQRIPSLFRGDSHLLDASRNGPAWRIKRAVLRRVYSWPAGLLYVGENNRAYYEAFGVGPNRLHACSHSIDVARFAEPSAEFEREAACWRRELGIAENCRVLLFAGKFERKKRPVELMRAVQQHGNRNLMLVMVGGGEYQDQVNAIAACDPARFRVLPFQNQSRMPVVYRLGDLFVLPSEFGETWGLAVNEALACGRPVLVSDRVGCAPDVVDHSCGRVFPFRDLRAMMQAVDDMTANPADLTAMGRAAARRAWRFDVSRTESALLDCLRTVLS